VNVCITFKCKSDFENVHRVLGFLFVHCDRGLANATSLHHGPRARSE